MARERLTVKKKPIDKLSDPFRLMMDANDKSPKLTKADLSPFSKSFRQINLGESSSEFECSDYDNKEDPNFFKKDKDFFRLPGHV